MNLLICDICGTLVHENTTRGFLAWLSARGVHRRAISAALSRPTSWLSDRTGVDVSRRWLLWSLRGLDREQLQMEANDYVARSLDTVGRVPLLKELEVHLATGGRLILASATIDPVAEAFAARLKAHASLSSRLEYDDRGRCRGRLGVDLTGRKWAALEPAVRSPRPAHIVFHTDNRSDLDVMRHADRVVFYGHPPAAALHELGPDRLTILPGEQR